MPYRHLISAEDELVEQMDERAPVRLSVMQQVFRDEMRKALVEK